MMIWKEGWFMKNNKFRVCRPLAGTRLCAAVNGLRSAVGMIALMVGLGVCMAPLHVGATSSTTCSTPTWSPDTVYVYVYDANDTPVLAPDATVQEGGVYTDSGFLGTINGSGMILDINNDVVGFLVYPVPSS
jgi:hypothetical protein